MVVDFHNQIQRIHFRHWLWMFQSEKISCYHQKSSSHLQISSAENARKTAREMAKLMQTTCYLLLSLPVNCGKRCDDMTMVAWRIGRQLQCLKLTTLKLQSFVWFSTAWGCVCGLEWNPVDRFSTVAATGSWWWFGFCYIILHKLNDYHLHRQASQPPRSGRAVSAAWAWVVWVGGCMEDKLFYNRVRQSRTKLEFPEW